MLREIGKKQYSKEVYSDADMLLNFNVLGAVDLNKSLTYLWGRNSNQFPLLSLTEGQGNISRKKPINAGDTQYKWKIMGKPTVTSPIVRLITPTQTPGKGFMSFKAEFQDNWIPYQYSARFIFVYFKFTWWNFEYNVLNLKVETYVRYTCYFNPNYRIKQT